MEIIKYLKGRSDNVSRSHPLLVSFPFLTFRSDSVDPLFEFQVVLGESWSKIPCGTHRWKSRQMRLLILARNPTYFYQFEMVIGRLRCLVGMHVLLWLNPIHYAGQNRYIMIIIRERRSFIIYFFLSKGRAEAFRLLPREASAPSLRRNKPLGMDLLVGKVRNYLKGGRLPQFIATSEWSRFITFRRPSLYSSDDSFSSSEKTGPGARRKTLPGRAHVIFNNLEPKWLDADFISLNRVSFFLLNISSLGLLSLSLLVFI